MIYHITRRSDWNAALVAGTYAADSLATEGFIHCSTAEQVSNTANRLFKGRRDLVLLSIDSDRVNPEIRYENLEGGADLFPHIYGALPVAAVVSVSELLPDDQGRFTPATGLKI